QIVSSSAVRSSLPGPSMLPQGTKNRATATATAPSAPSTFGFASVWPSPVGSEIPPPDDDLRLLLGGGVKLARCAGADAAISVAIDSAAAEAGAAAGSRAAGAEDVCCCA